MSEKSKINRRQFIQRSALGSAAMGMALGEGHGEAPEVPARVPASDKVTVGMIGVGARAQELMQAIMTLPGTEIVGVCDAYKGRTDRAVARTKGRAKVSPLRTIGTQRSQSTRFGRAKTCTSRSP